MPTAQEIKSAFPGYAGWNDEAAIIANFNATGGAGKEGGGSSGSSSGSSSAPMFDTDAAWSTAEAEALKELSPYYEKLLSMYKGNIALAKQQMDKDYERGLRVKSEQVATDTAEIEKQKAERQRRFKIALNDLDQRMNARGLATSGIRTTETNRATANEAYQQGVLEAQQVALNKGLDYYKEESDSTRNKQLEQWGMKPVTAANNPTGQFAPSNEGLNTAGFDVSGYVNEVDAKQAELEKAKAQDVTTMASNAYNRAYTNWQSNINRLVQST